MVAIKESESAPSDEPTAERSVTAADAGPASKAAVRDVPASPTAKEGPDPVVGIGLVILGILVMGVAGAATMHYLFNIGTAIAIVGAAVFIVSVVLSSLKEKKLSALRDSSPGDPVTKS